MDSSRSQASASRFMGQKPFSICTHLSPSFYASSAQITPPQVHLLARKGTTELIAVMDQQPTYKQVEDLLRARPTSRMNMGLFDRLKDEYEWSQDSLKGGPPQ